MTQYNREGADDELVAALLASVSPPASGSASGNGRALRRQEHKAAVADDRAEGEEAGCDQPGSDDEREVGDDKEGEGREIDEVGDVKAADELDEGGEVGDGAGFETDAPTPAPRGAGGREAGGDCQEVWDDEGGRSLHHQQARDEGQPPADTAPDVLHRQSTTSPSRCRRSAASAPAHGTSPWTARRTSRPLPQASRRRQRPPPQRRGRAQRAGEQTRSPSSAGTC